MTKLSGVPPRGVVLGFKGILDFYSWKGITVVRRWPRAKSQPQTPQEVAQHEDFKLVTQGFKLIDSTVMPALTSMVTGTQLVQKDQQVQLFYGYGIEEENGVWP